MTRRRRTTRTKSNRREDTFIGLRVSSALVAEIDSWALDNDGVTRSKAVRQLVEAALWESSRNARTR